MENSPCRPKRAYRRLYESLPNFLHLEGSRARASKRDVGSGPRQCKKRNDAELTDGLAKWMEADIVHSTSVAGQFVQELSCPCFPDGYTLITATRCNLLSL